MADVLVVTGGAALGALIGGDSVFGRVVGAATGAYLGSTQLGESAGNVVRSRASKAIKYAESRFAGMPRGEALAVCERRPTAKSRRRCERAVRRSRR